MSEALGLGEADADVRWIGVRRHQAILVVIGFGLVSDWIMSRRPPLAELVTGLCLMVGAIPVGDGLTIAEYVFVVTRYVTRAHWFELVARELGEDLVLWARGEASFRGYELVHRGRLDLSGRDVALAEDLAALADAASAARSGQHFSQHVTVQRESVATLLALPGDLPVPDGWRANSSLAREVVGVRESTTRRVLERFTYLRTPSELLRVYRIRDFSSVPRTRALLEQTLRSPVPFTLAVHFDVVAGAKAQRLAARAVHRVRSDEATSTAAGFRRTARTSRNFERLAQREVLVASGRSLLRVAVFLIVRGETLEEVQRRGALAWRSAHDAGLRLERGRGRQLSWYVAQLPGGPSW
jgi:hypothetical protein